ncbi:hypothetical protein PENTCL1PPCAC_7862, partial [Pristionchus entomophagus]
NVAPFLFLLLLALTHCNACPEGYTQAPHGGDCFKGKSFYDAFATPYFAKTFDEAETACNFDGGGLLTSIHSDEENNFVTMKVYCN